MLVVWAGRLFVWGVTGIGAEIWRYCGLMRIDWRLGLMLGAERLKLGERSGAGGTMGEKLVESPGV